MEPAQDFDGNDKNSTQTNNSYTYCPQGFIEQDNDI